MASPGRIELDKLSVEQLKGLKEQTDLEVNLLQDSLTKIRTATTRLESASAALQDLSLRPHGKYIVVPHRLRSPLLTRVARFVSFRFLFLSAADWLMVTPFASVVGVQGRRCSCPLRLLSTFPALWTTPRRSSSTSAPVTSSR